MKKIINCLIIQSILITLSSYPQYNASAYKSVMRFDNFGNIMKDGKHKIIPLIVIFKLNKKQTEDFLKEEFVKKIIENDGSQGNLTKDIEDIVLENYDRRMIKNIEFNYPILKVYPLLSHYLMYLSENEYPFHKGIVSVKTLKNYIKLKINKTDHSEVELKKIMYRK